MEEEGALADLLAAAGVIAAPPATRSLIAFPVASAVTEGAIDLLVVVLAVRVLALGAGALRLPQCSLRCRRAVGVWRPSCWWAAAWPFRCLWPRWWVRSRSPR